MDTITFQDWLTVNPSEGNAEGSLLNIATEHTGRKPRSLAIRVQAKKNPAVHGDYTVTQASPGLIFDPEPGPKSASNDAGEAEYDGYTNAIKLKIEEYNESDHNATRKSVYGTYTLRPGETVFYHFVNTPVYVIPSGGGTPFTGYARMYPGGRYDDWGHPCIAVWADPDGPNGPDSSYPRYVMLDDYDGPTGAQYVYDVMSLVPESLPSNAAKPNYHSIILTGTDTAFTIASDTGKVIGYNDRRISPDVGATSARYFTIYVNLPENNIGSIVLWKFKVTPYNEGEEAESYVAGTPQVLQIQQSYTNLFLTLGSNSVQFRADGTSAQPNVAVHSNDNWEVILL